MRDAAKRGHPGLFHDWATAMAARLYPGGSLTLIVPAASMPVALAALEAAGCGSTALLPLWPRQGSAAQLVIVRGYKGARNACRLLPGLVLHNVIGFTFDATVILWHGAGLPL
jgi:tRNA1(Val) A37 N6-methylase TrmN6